MNRSWSPPTPLDMVCGECKATIPRGSTLHQCGYIEGVSVVANARGELHEAVIVKPIEPDTKARIERLRKMGWNV